MNHYVLDASALLALLKLEARGEQVAEAIANGAAISVVNFSEVVAKLSEAGMPESAIHESLDSLGLEVVDFNAVIQRNWQLSLNLVTFGMDHNYPRLRARGQLLHSDSHFPSSPLPRR